MNYDLPSFMMGLVTGLKLPRPGPDVLPPIGTVWENADGTCQAVELETAFDINRYTTGIVGINGRNMSVTFATANPGDRILATQYNGEAYVLALNELGHIANGNVGMAELEGSSWYTNYNQTANLLNFVWCSDYCTFSTNYGNLILPVSAINPTTVTIDTLHPVTPEQEA